MSYRGIAVKECKTIATRDLQGATNGFVIPVLSSLEDKGFVSDERFAQYYVTIAHPGAMKGWHTHAKKTGHFFVADGLVKLVLYDGRRFKEFLMGREGGIERNLAVRIPPGIATAFKTVGSRNAIIINYSHPPFDPRDAGEMRTTDIPYDWR